MNERLWAAINGSEPQTGAAMVQVGLAVVTYGQGMLSPDAREMLRGEQVPELWTPDFLVSRPTVTDRPRWPRTLRPKHAFLVDAKWASPSTGNHSIEMRSLIAAPTFGFEVFYVCSNRYGDEYRDFGVIHYAQVLRGRHQPCCSSCHHVLRTSDDPMRELPRKCPVTPRTNKSSGTPYVYFSGKELQPLSYTVFDCLSPAQLAKLGPPYGLRDKP